MTWAPVKPKSARAPSTRKAGSPLMPVPTRKATRRSDMEPISASASASSSAASPTGWAWKLAPKQHVAGSDIDRLIVRHSAQLSVEHAGGEDDPVEDSAHHLRQASQAIGGLHARHGPVSLNAAAVEQRPQRPGDGRLPRLPAERMDSRVEDPDRPAAHLDAQLSAAQASASGKHSSARNSRSMASAVETYVPFTSASPSFGPGANGVRPDSASARRRDPDTAQDGLALAQQAGAEMGQRREIARRPDRPVGRDHRQQVGGQDRLEPVDAPPADARRAGGDGGERQRHDPPHHLRGQRWPHTRGVR